MAGPGRASSIRVTSPPPEHALPPKARWFFLAGPPLMAFLFDPQCVKEPGHLVRAMVAIVTFTVVTGLAVHHAFDALERRLRARGIPTAARVPIHAIATTLVVGLVSLPQLPLVRFVYPEATGSELDIVWRAVLVSFAYLGVASFIGHLQREAVRQRLKAHEERVAALETRLRLLQGQMQPHFLFNSLNVCAGLIHEDPDAAEQTLDRLTELLRYSLESTERRLVTLGEELAAVRGYLEVQRKRFGDRLRFELRSDVDHRMVPPMLVQPLVENAVLHGIQARVEGGSVTVEATERDGALVITVEDGGVGPGGSSRQGTGTGQRNVAERLELVFGPAARLDVGPSDAGGYRSAITIPATA